MTEVGRGTGSGDGPAPGSEQGSGPRPTARAEAGPGAGVADLAGWVGRFWQEEMDGVGRAGGGDPVTVGLAAIGTVAPRAVANPRLAKVFGSVGAEIDDASAHAGPAELVADGRWQLALVLSPWKREVHEACDELSASAAVSGVVDTLLRRGGTTVGVNTNTWAAQAAMRALRGGNPVRSVAVLGTGSSARSVLMAVKREWPDSRSVVLGRRPEQVAGLVGFCGAEGNPDGSPPDLYPMDLIVNTTSYGETNESEERPMEIDVEPLFGVGVAYFDLNNRVGALPASALARGCTVQTGTYMQTVTDLLRASLAASLDTARS